MRPSKALKTLLWVNELRESKAQEDFARGKRALQELEKLLAEVSSRPQKLYEEIAQKKVTGEDLRFFSFKLSQILREKQEVERILQEKRNEVEKLRQNAIKAHQKKRIAETLYEKAAQAYRRELEELERKELDDLVLLRRKNDAGL